MRAVVIALLSAAIVPHGLPAHAAAPPQSALVHPGPDGHLVYRTYDDKGDTILDFSNCGYAGGGVALPQASVKVTLAPQPGDGDDLPRLQKAIDDVSHLPLGVDGLRGAVLLQRGHYRLSGTLRIATSGVVLRGEGATADDTFLLSTARDAKPLIEVGSARDVALRSADATRIVDDYVPVGARTMRVVSAAGLHVGDTVIVRRMGNAAWIHALSMDQIVPRKTDPEGTKQWSPFSVDFDRTITAIGGGDRITLDAPIACAIDSQWGGGSIVPYINGRIEHVGVENLYAESVYDKTKTSTVGVSNGKPYLADENHATYFVAFENVQNGWARGLSARFLAQGIAIMEHGAKWITVQDCSMTDPISIITGGRRYTYNISGQLCLVQRCYARDARHAFVVAAGHTAGPNAFVDCKCDDSHATSEPHQRWSVGGLYDNVSAPMAIQDRQWMGSGHGWAGANFVVWNSEGSLTCQQPPTAQNFAIGFVGKREPGAFVRPQGFWESLGTHVAPRSLYLTQLEDRLGKQAVRNVTVL